MRAQIKRTPVTLIGSSLIRGGLQKPPQAPPISNAALTPQSNEYALKILGFERPAKTNPVVAFHRLFGSAPAPPEKILTIDDVFPVAMPFCPHNIRLTKDEYIFERSYKRKYHMLIYGKKYFVKPISFECIDCYPVCLHKMTLTPKEVASRIRFSGHCPECVGKFTNAANLATYLTKQGLGIYDGMSLSEGEFVTSYGVKISKAGKNYVQAGGSKETEQLDASYVQVVDDGKEVAAVATPSGPDHSGYGPDDHYDFDGDKVDDLGDPISFAPSETVKGFEQARTESTKESLDIISYEIIPAENQSGWIVTGNGTEISRHDTRKGAQKAIRELTEFDRLNFKSTRSKNATKLEHKKADLVTEFEIPAGPEKLTGLKDQKVNRKVWTASEERDLQDEITEQIESCDIPVRAAPNNDNDA